MTVVEGVDKIISHRVTKRHGYSQKFGTSFFAYTRFGEFNKYAGIYQRYPTRKGIIIRRAAFYWPVSPQTSAQIVCQNKFALAVAGWQSLTTDQKQSYNRRVGGRHMSGYNVYIKEYMNS